MGYYLLQTSGFWCMSFGNELTAEQMEGNIIYGTVLLLTKYG